MANYSTPKLEHLHFAERKTTVKKTPQKVFQLVLGTATKKIMIEPKMVTRNTFFSRLLVVANEKNSVSN